jgi:hypothetical protein
VTDDPARRVPAGPDHPDTSSARPIHPYRFTVGFDIDIRRFRRED